MDAVHRLNLQAKLEETLGSENVYFQPPPNLKMSYPCIVYERDDIDVSHADNEVFTQNTRYQVTFIRHEPDSPIVDKLLRLPYSSYRRGYTISDLNHDVFAIYH